MKIDPSYRRLIEGTDPAFVSEISALATTKDPQHRMAASKALALYWFRYCVENDLHVALIIVEARMLRLLNNVVGLPFKAIGPEQTYLGETIPAFLDLRRFVIDLTAGDSPTGDLWMSRARSALNAPRLSS